MKACCPDARWRSAWTARSRCSRPSATPRADTRYVVFSCTKPIVASAIWLLLAEGKVDLAEKVTSYLPDFGTNGKDVITLEQVMVHTSGFPHAPMGPRHWSTHETRRARYAEWRLNWEPGTASAYHPSSAHWVLADIIEAVSGADYRRFVAERICSPLGLPRMQLGVPRDQQADIAELLSVGVPLSAAEWKEATGVDGLNLGEVTQDNLVALHHPAALEVGHPGGGLVSTAADLARFYQALLHNPGELWDPAILADATSHIRHTMRDDTLMVVANRTLGLMVAGDDDLAAWRGMGRTAHRARSATTAPAARSHGPTPIPACRSVMSPTVSTPTCSATAAAASPSAAAPP